MAKDKIGNVIDRWSRVRRKTKCIRGRPMPVVLILQDKPQTIFLYNLTHTIHPRIPKLPFQCGLLA